MAAPDTRIYPRVLCLAPAYAPPRATGDAPALPGDVEAASAWSGVGGDRAVIGRRIEDTLRQLDATGVRQVVVCARPAGAPNREPIGNRMLVRRIGPAWAFPLIAGGSIMRLARTADVLHLHHAAELTAPALIAATASAWDIPLVMTVHESHFFAPEASDATGRARLALARRLERAAARRAIVLIAPTRALAERLAAEGVPQRRIRVVPPELPAADSARQLLEIYRAVWARHLARQVAIWHPTPG